MATSSIKLFQFVRKFDQIFGHPCQLNQKKQCSSNSSAKTIFVISCAQYMFATFAFLVFEAETMFDYGFVFFALVTIANSFAVYLIFVWQSENTLILIENCERFIGKSKFSVLVDVNMYM